MKGFGFTAIQTTLISTCPAAVIQLLTFLVFSYIASKHNNIRLYLSILVSIPPLIGASLLHTLPTTNTAGRLAGYFLTYTSVLDMNRLVAYTNPWLVIPCLSLSVQALWLPITPAIPRSQQHLVSSSPGGQPALSQVLVRSQPRESHFIS